MRRTGQPAPSLAELYAWDATVDIMILSPCSVLREYWERDAESYNETIASLFSRARWEAILANLHFADRAVDYPTDESGAPCQTLPASERDWDIRGFKDLLVKQKMQ